MRILLVHPNYPSQLRALAQHLAASSSHQVLFLTENPRNEIPGVRKVLYKPKRSPSPHAHRYLSQFENAVLHGQAACEACIALKREGFIPDIILGHSGWGTTLFLKDVFPRSPLILVCEWYYNAHGSDADFDPSEPLTIDDEARIRVKNAPILIDIAACDGGLVPTKYQYSQFPDHLTSRLKVSHEGIDTRFFSPDANETLVLPDQALDLSHCKEIVTYATRGMEPYRGFPQFMEAAFLLQQQRPNVHIVVGGEDRVAYGRSAGKDTTYKTLMLEKYPYDLDRLHFVGSLPLASYRKLLRCSSVHVYLTRPFVLSWSLLEAMSCGAVVVASDTPPAREVINDGINGFLVDFFRPDLLAERLSMVLDEQSSLVRLRENARLTIASQYELVSCVRRRKELLFQFAVG
jgi:glycosyltransferase involved in cell wall biosynthesis